MNDKKRFAKLMVILAEIFTPDKTVSKEKIEVYHESLRRFTIDDIEQAAKRIINTKTFHAFPLPAEFISIIEEGLNSDSEMKGLEAWSEICRHASVMGYFEPTCSDPLIQHAVDMAFGGLRKFGEHSPDQDPANRKHFLNVYKRLLTREKERRLEEGVTPGQLAEGDNEE